MSNGAWTDKENDLIVADYFAMLADDIAGRPYNKAEHRRALLPLLNDRSEGSVECVSACNFDPLGGVIGVQF